MCQPQGGEKQSANGDDGFFAAGGPSSPEKSVKSNVFWAKPMDAFDFGDDPMLSGKVAVGAAAEPAKEPAKK